MPAASDGDEDSQQQHQHYQQERQPGSSSFGGFSDGFAGYGEDNQPKKSGFWD